MNNEFIVFGGGCFWCIEAVFEMVKGVSKVASGYTGGHVKNPTYEAVSSGTSGHAEVVRVEYDPAVITSEDLLNVFFAVHDPTELNRQGNDVGEQYRSAIFYTTEEQKIAAEKFVSANNASKEFHDSIVTQIEPLGDFYPAEDYHKAYYRQNRSQSYCQLVIDPKIAKFKKRFQELLKK